MVGKHVNGLCLECMVGERWSVLLYCCKYVKERESVWPLMLDEVGKGFRGWGKILLEVSRALFYFLRGTELGRMI